VVVGAGALITSFQKTSACKCEVMFVSPCLFPHRHIYVGGAHFVLLCWDCSHIPVNARSENTEGFGAEVIFVSPIKYPLRISNNHSTINVVIERIMTKNTTLWTRHKGQLDPMFTPKRPLLPEGYSTRTCHCFMALDVWDRRSKIN
jgi:hypothetical protein